MNVKCLLLILFLFPAIVFSYSLKDHLDSQIDPRIPVKTIETKFFAIHYQVSYEQLAFYIAAIADNIHDRVTSELKINWTEKTHIVVAHRTDVPAIFSMAFPHNQIFLEPTLPSFDVGLNNFDSWYQWVLIHEYTHILHLNLQPNTTAKSLQPLFGSWLKPNQLLPTWLKEGHAVKMETKLSRAGRGGSSLYQMILRSAVHENKLNDSTFVNTDNISNFEDTTWPWTLRPYLFGYYMVADLTTLEQPVDDVDQLFNSTLDEITERAKSEINQIVEQPLTNLNYITNTGYYYYSPQISKDGQLLMVTHDEPNRPPHILGFQKINNIWVKNDNLDDLIYRHSGYQSELSSNRKYITYDYLTPSNQFYLQSEIAIMNLADHQIVSSSLGLRARDATIHPNGEELAFIINEQGKNFLVKSNTNWEKIEKLTPDLKFTRLTAPRYSPDGSKIIFTAHNDLTGGEDIWLWHNYKISILVSDGSANIFPSWSNSEDEILYSSDKTGVFNIYKLNISQKTVLQISNVIGGLFYPVIDSNKEWIYAVSYRSTGYDLVRFQPDKNLPVRSFALESIEELSSEAYRSNLSKGAIAKDFSAVNYESRKYLLPQYMYPMAFFQPGQSFVGFETGSVDPLFFQSYLMRLFYDDVSRKLSGNLFYYKSFDRQAIDLSMQVENHSQKSSLDLRKSTTIGAHLNLPISEDTNNLHWRPGIKYLSRDGVETFEWLGATLGLRYDGEYKPRGSHIPESGTFLEGNYNYLFSNKKSTDIGNIDLKYRLHSSIDRETIFHIQVIGRANTNDHPQFQHFAGGRLSFPYTWDSSLTFYGYPINAIASERIAVADAYLTKNIRFIGKKMLTDSLYFSNSYLGFRAQAAAAERLASSTAPWSAGVEVIQDVVAESIFDFTLKLGLYQGEKIHGGETQVYFSINGSDW